MATYFGPSAHPASSNVAGNYCYTGKATCGLTGNITTARIWAFSTSTTNVVFVVYSVAGGVPASRLGFSNPLLINSSTAQFWNFVFGTPVAVTNGVEYALGVLCDNANATMGWTAGTGTYYYNANTYPTPEATYSVDGSGAGLWAFEAGVDAAGGAVFVPTVTII